MRWRSRLGCVRSSMVLRKRRNSRCRWRGMHWPMTLPVEHVQRREQGRGPIALVVVGHRAGAPLLHGQTGLGPVQRLNLAFFIDAEDRGLVRRIEIEPDHVL